jgi:hypothetical protein
VQHPLATIGGWYTNNSFNAGGSIGEVLLYGTALSPAVVGKLQATLLAKWRGIWGS